VTPEVLREIEGVVPPELTIGAEAPTDVTGGVPEEIALTSPFAVTVTLAFV
jgi:hypothetical protein